MLISKAPYASLKADGLGVPPKVTRMVAVGRKAEPLTVTTVVGGPEERD
jgi:hypothetical protein